jgi:hypothetical protein
MCLHVCPGLLNSCYFAWLHCSYIGVQAGGIFVDHAAAAHFERLLSSTGLSGSELRAHVREAVESFRDGGKKAFEDPSRDDVAIEVGGYKFTNASIGVRRGTMMLDGSVDSQSSQCLISLTT